MPHNNLGEIAKSWMFASSSGSGMYETILYVKGTSSCGVSCNCRGWVQHVDKKTGQRSCKHTRYVEQGVADQAAESFKTYASIKGGKVADAVDAFAYATIMEPGKKPAGKVVGARPVQKPTDTSSGRPKSRFLPNDTSGDEDLVDVERFRKM